MLVQSTKQRGKPVYLDLTYLQQISEGDTVFECEILTIYLKETPRLAQNIQKALKARKYIIAANLVHELKSKIRIIGLKQAWGLADLIEMSLRKKVNLPQLPNNLNVFFKVIHKSISLTNKELLKRIK
ncbi:MAG: Hpt domain-containing protein [Chitinophagales bacterium]